MLLRVNRNPPLHSPISRSGCVFHFLLVSMYKQSLFPPRRISVRLLAHFSKAVLPVCVCVHVGSSPERTLTRSVYAHIVISLNNKAPEIVGSLSLPS